MSEITARPIAALAGKLLLTVVAVGLAACNPEAKQLRLSCQDGNAEDCNELGYRLLTGDHVLKDFVFAADVLRQACDGGVARGCYRLGRMHEDSIGIIGDLDLMIALYRHTPTIESRVYSRRRVSRIVRPWSGVLWTGNSASRRL
jgi:hypothetical protein